MLMLLLIGALSCSGSKEQSEEKGWDDGVLLTPGWCAYTEAMMIDDHTIGYIAEEDEEMSLVFYTIGLQDLPLIEP